MSDLIGNHIVCFPTNDIASLVHNARRVLGSGCTGAIKVNKGAALYEKKENL